MGLTPIPPRSTPPTRESFHLGRAKAAYVANHLSLERFETLVEHVLKGGVLPEYLGIEDSPFEMPEMEYRH